MSDLQNFIDFIIGIPIQIWNVVRANAGVYIIVPIVMILLPFARRLWNRIIKM